MNGIVSSLLEISDPAYQRDICAYAFDITILPEGKKWTIYSTGQAASELGCEAIKEVFEFLSQKGYLSERRG